MYTHSVFVLVIKIWLDSVAFVKVNLSYRQNLSFCVCHSKHRLMLAEYLLQDGARPDLMAHTCNLSICEVEGGGSGVQG